MKMMDYSGKCMHCPLSQKLDEHFMLEGIDGLFDDFSQEIYETCERCSPGLKSKFETLRYAFIWARNVEKAEGHEAAIDGLRGFFSYCEVSESNIVYLIEFYNKIKGIKNLDEFAD